MVHSPHQQHEQTLVVVLPFQMAWAALTPPLQAQLPPTGAMKVTHWLMWVTLWYISVLATLMAAGVEVYQSVKVSIHLQ